MNYEKDDLHEILERAAEYFQLLLDAPAGDGCRRYAEDERGLSQETIRKWQLGYSENQWQGLLEQTRHRGIEDALLLESGLAARADTGRVYDRFRDRLMFPVRDVNGRVVTFGGRKMAQDDNQPKYLNGSDTRVFDKSNELFGLYEALQAGPIKRAIVVEGYMDVVSLDQAAVQGAVATMGTATSASNVEKLFTHTDQIVFCFDGDQAGRDAAEKALRAVMPCLSPERVARIVFLPEGEDPDTLVRQIGREGFERLVESGQPILDYMLEVILREKDLASVTDRTKAVTEGSEYLSLMANGECRELTVRRVAEATMVDRRELALRVPCKPAGASRSAMSQG